MQQHVYSRKVKIGFFVAPFISCVVGLAGIFIFALLTSNFSNPFLWPDLKTFISEAVQIFLFMLGIAYMITLLFGVPCFFVLKHINAVNLFSLLLSAYAISNLVLLLPSLLGSYGFSGLLSRHFLAFILLCPLHLITLLGAFCFWWIAIRPRQDMVITHKIPGDKSYG